MERIFGRYRHIAAMLAAIAAQLLLLAYQVKTGEDVRLIRIWAISAVTPLARLLDSAREGTQTMLERYLRLAAAQEENRRLRLELDRLRMENLHLKQELATAERAGALAAFRARLPSRTLAARVIAASSGPGTKAIIADRGAAEGVRRGMAVITPEGVVGKVIAVYPAASQVLLITDPGFAAGVISEVHRVQGTLKGTGQRYCRVDYLQNEDPVDKDEWFYTSGEDLVFPRGLPVGRVQSVNAGRTFKEITVEPSGLARGLSEVLIVLEGVHQPLPGETEALASELFLLPPPNARPAGEPLATGTLATDADRLREHYRRLGEAQGHVFGQGTPGSRPPDFNWRPGSPTGARPGTAQTAEPNRSAPNAGAASPRAPSPGASPPTAPLHGPAR